MDDFAVYKRRGLEIKQQIRQPLQPLPTTSKGSAPARTGATEKQFQVSTGYQKNWSVPHRTDILCLRRLSFLKRQMNEQRMSTPGVGHTLILVIDEVEETRDAMEKLLKADGYIVSASRDEQEAIERGKRENPELILMSRGAQSEDFVATIRRIRDNAALDRTVPGVIFCVETIAEGAEVDIGENTYLIRPDNFDQLRRLVRRLLH